MFETFEQGSSQGPEIKLWGSPRRECKRRLLKKGIGNKLLVAAVFSKYCKYFFPVIMYSLGMAPFN